MDPTSSAAQDVQTQQPSDQQVNPVTTVPSKVNDQSVPQMPKPILQPKSPISVPGGVESGGSIMVQEDAEDDEDDEDELKVAHQETKNQVMMGQGGEEEDDEQQIVSAQPSVVDVQEESVELQPSVPEVVTSSVEVEKIIEKSPDQEKPDIPKVVRDIGVTHSGPGVIAVDPNDFKVKALPVTFDQAVQEERITKLHDSKHWLMGMVAYIWRKLNPKLKEKDVKKLKANIEKENNGNMVK